MNAPNHPVSAQLASLETKVIETWLAEVKKTLFGRGEREPVLRNDIPEFLARVSLALAPHTTDNACDNNTAARRHGRQRAFSTDFSLEDVVAEYILLRRVIFSLLEEQGPIGQRERDIILDSVETAIKHASGEFVAHRMAAEKKHKSELELTNAKLTHANHELEDFVAVVTHDLKEPLRTISTFLDLLLKQEAPNLSSKAQDYVAFTHQAAKRMNHRIDALLGLACLKKPTDLTVTDLNEVLTETTELLGTLITDAEAEVKWDPLPKVLGNKVLLGQLFQNLISNSVRYRSEAKPVISVKVLQEEDNWVISVKDNGLGFAASDSQRIFRPFERLQSQTSDGHLGLGLTICRRIVSVHQGKIWAHSEPRQGAVFSFTIPIRSEKTATTEVRAPLLQESLAAEVATSTADNDLLGYLTS